MKAVYLDKKAGAESLVDGELAKPVPGPSEILVKVHATAVTPTELQWYPTFNTPAGEPRPFPIVLSHEFSGVVESFGVNVTGFQPGDAVFGLNDWFANGAQAEYCVVAATALAHKPRLHQHVQAAVVPISALTVWQAYMEKARLQAGQRVLIHGGAGAVGVFAIQLARWRGAHVIATASCGNLGFVRALGAHEVIDRCDTRFEDVVRDIDVVFDTVGGETLDRSWAVLAPGGRVVTIAAQSAGSADQRVRDAFMLVRADGFQLAQIANLIDAGELCAFVERVFPLAATREAYSHAQRGKNRGKVALQVAG